MGYDGQTKVFPIVDVEFVQRALLLLSTDTHQNTIASAIQERRVHGHVRCSLQDS